MKRYGVIYADPPWTYKDKAHAGKRGVEYKYPTMTLEQIQALPVQRIAADDCLLFLWATPPLILDALATVFEWGFTYKTIAHTWVKRTKHNKLHWGMGNWTRANPEHVLLGVKGRPKRLSASIHSVVEARVRRHSAKPAVVRKLIEQLAKGPYLELFAREHTPGWDIWGNEVDGIRGWP